MGTDVHIVAVDPKPRALDRARARIDELERLWTRFAPSSEVSRLNVAAGDSVPVSWETRLLVRRAIDGWRATAGRFDPTVLHAMNAAGYDRTFDRIRGGVATLVREPRPTPGCEGIEVDEGSGTVSLPPGVGFDPGGIGKGLAADLVAEETLADGLAAGICVNVGGDLRVAGTGPDAGPWVVAIEDPFGGEPAANIALEDGAIATSSRLRRAWRNGERMVHHLIDPATGASAESPVVSTSVLAGKAWWAEVLSKAAFLAAQDEAAELLEAQGTPALVTLESGEMLAIAGMEELLP